MRIRQWHILFILEMNNVMFNILLNPFTHSILMVNKPRERDRRCFTMAQMITIKAKKQITPAIIPSIALLGKPFCSSFVSVKKKISVLGAFL